MAMMTGNLVTTLHDLATQNGWLNRQAFAVHSATRTFETCTYADVFAQAGAAAAALTRHGAGPGDRVLIALPDGLDFVRAFLGTLHAGAVAIPVNPMLPGKDLAVLLDSAAPAVAVGGPALARAAGGRWRVLAPADLAGGLAPPVEARGPDDDAFAQFTSGTTGHPKLVFHSHADPVVHDQAFGKPVLGLRPGTVTLSVSKSFFSYGLGNSVFFPMFSGATAVLEPGQPTEDVILAVIEAREVDVLFAVPSVYARLLAHPAVAGLRRLRIAFCATEALPAVVEAGITALGGPVLLNGYGSTEAGSTYVSNALGASRTGTVGKVMPPYRVKVTDEAGRELPPGAEGRLAVQGPTMSAPAATLAGRPPRDPARWHPTGDVAVIDPGGFIRIAGRSDDLEIVGGVNVHPAEVEDALRNLPQVTDVAVCAVPDARGVSRLVAYVVPEPGGPGEDAGKRLIGRLRGTVSAHKVPSDVVFVTGLPRTPTGKLRRRALREAGAAYELTGRWPT
jgi:fatty acid CoA ligase FadD22